MAFDAGVEREPSQLEKDLLAAKELVVRHGWVQNEMGNTDRGFCVVGALQWHVCMGDLDRPMQVGTIHRQRFDAMMDTMQKCGPFGQPCSIPQQNDERGMTKAEVLKWFDRGIAIARGERVTLPSRSRPAVPFFSVKGCNCPTCQPGSFPGYPQPKPLEWATFKDFFKV